MNSKHSCIIAGAQLEFFVQGLGRGEEGG